MTDDDDADNTDFFGNVMEATEEDPPTPNEISPRMIFTSTSLINVPLPLENDNIIDNSDTAEDTAVDDDIEALAAKAQALASVPIPFETKNKNYRKQKYKKKIVRRSRRDKDPNSVMLASKTSNILSNFQEYIHEIEEEADDGDESPMMMDFMLNDTSPNTTEAVELDVELGDNDREEQEGGLIHREWAYNVEHQHGREAKHNRWSSRHQNLHHNYESPHGAFFKSRKKRRYWYTHPKFGLVGIFVLIVVVVGAIMIGISSSDGGGGSEKQLDTNYDNAMVEQRPEGKDWWIDVENKEEDDDDLQETNDWWDKEPNNEKPLPAEESMDAKEEEEHDEEANVESEDKTGDPLVIGLSNEPQPCDTCHVEPIVESFEVKEEFQPGISSSEGGNKETDDSMQEANNYDKDKIGDPMVIGLSSKDPSQPSAAEPIIEFLNVKDKYDPNWFARATGWNGTSWPESVDFCASQQMTLCPYDAYCAEVDRTDTIYEEKDVVLINSSTEQWSPVSNEVNSWVQIEGLARCVLYKDMYPYAEPPEWETNGMYGQLITQNVLCCKAGHTTLDENDDSPSSEVGNDPTLGATSTISQSSAPEVTKEDLLAHEAANLDTHKQQEFDYQPKIYDRNNGGWEGKTWIEAVKFCAEKEGYHICPYEAVCPLGPEREPYGGFKYDDNDNGSWVPISDDGDDWVSISSNSAPCIRYSIEFRPHPDWGYTGVGDEDMTRNIMCCRGSVLGGAEESFMYKVASRLYHPMRFDRTDGWTGQTHNEAVDFCQMRKKSLCSYQAICPMEDWSVPLGGVVMDETETNGSWIPVSDNANEWISVGKENTCKRYGEIMNDGQPPSDNEDLTRHIACCDNTVDVGEVDVSQFAGTPKTSPPSPAPSKEPTPPPTQAPTTSSPTKKPTPSPTANPTKKPTPSPITASPIKKHTASTVPNDFTGNLDYDDVKEIYSPKWHHRNETSTGGWFGVSYTNAITFCAQQDSSIPCPYEAYCPQGPGSEPTDGARETRGEAWAPIMDIPNGWVNVGSSSDSCELYNSIHTNPPLWGLTGRNVEGELDLDEDVKDITAHIMCCREPDSNKPTTLQATVSVPVPVAKTPDEQEILDKKRPIWFTRKHGYQGTTHANAVDFCKSVGDMVVCPRDTYCPNGPRDSKVLFLQRDAFEGEQWAPVATSDTRSSHTWIQVGKLDKASQSTCATVGDVQGMKPAGWDADDADPELKENVLCCLNPNHLLKEMNLDKGLDRIWLDESFGWLGGSHDDAEQFCKKLGNKSLCPYAAYCPGGPGRAVTGGHIEDFNMEGEQWAPVHHPAPNGWVMIGRKYQNSATTCMDNWALEGKPPDWGLTNERAEIKKKIMCCSF